MRIHAPIGSRPMMFATCTVQNTPSRSYAQIDMEISQVMCSTLINCETAICYGMEYVYCSSAANRWAHEPSSEVRRGGAPVKELGAPVKESVTVKENNFPFSILPLPGSIVTMMHDRICLPINFIPKFTSRDETYSMRYS